MMSRITLSLRKYAKPDEDDWVHNKFNIKLSSFHAAAAPDFPMGMNHHHHHNGPRRAPGETTFGSYSAHVPTLVPHDPSRPPPPRPISTILPKSSKTDPEKGDAITFGSDSALAATYVPPPGTDRQIDNPDELGAGLARVQFRSVSPIAPVPGTRTPLRTPVRTPIHTPRTRTPVQIPQIPRIRTPVQTFAEWTFGVGGPLRPSAWHRHPESGFGLDAAPSDYSQESMEGEEIELDDAKDGVRVEHIERA
jgi:hypothetical protein